MTRTTTTTAANLDEQGTRPWEPTDHEHPILAEHAKLRAARQAANDAREQAKTAVERHRTEVRAWEIAAAEAWGSGATPPSRPADFTPAMQRQLEDRARILDEQVKRVTAEIAEEVRAQLVERLADIYAEVSEAWSRFGALADETKSLGVAAEVLDRSELGNDMLASGRINVTGGLDAESLLRHVLANMPTFGVAREEYRNWERR